MNSLIEVAMTVVFAFDINAIKIETVLSTSMFAVASLERGKVSHIISNRSTMEYGQGLIVVSCFIFKKMRYSDVTHLVHSQSRSCLASQVKPKRPRIGYVIGYHIVVIGSIVE